MPFLWVLVPDPAHMSLGGWLKEPATTSQLPDDITGEDGGALPGVLRQSSSLHHTTLESLGGYVFCGQPNVQGKKNVKA